MLHVKWKLFILLAILPALDCGYDASLEFISGGFSFTPLSGQKGVTKFDIKTLYSDEKDKPQYLIINFFAPDCPPCIKELPELETLHREIASPKSNIHYFSVGSLLEILSSEKSSDEIQDDLKTIDKSVLTFVQEHQIKYPVYLAGIETLKNYRVTGFPETLVWEIQGNTHRLLRKFVSAIKVKEILAYLGNSPHHSSYQ